MAEQTGDQDAQGAEESQAQGATTPPEGDAQGATSGEEESVEALKRKVADLEKDNLSYREERRKREAAEKTKTKSEQSESERLSARVTELERQLEERDKRTKEQSLRLASVTAAQQQGFRNPDLAYRLIDTAKVEYDEDGNAKNVEPLLRAVAESDPYLLAATDFGGGPRGQSAAARTDDMNALIRKAAGR